MVSIYVMRQKIQLDLVEYLSKTGERRLHILQSSIQKEFQITLNIGEIVKLLHKADANVVSKFRQRFEEENEKCSREHEWKLNSM